MSDSIHFDPPEPAELSALLDGYEVTDLIATGGMGAVYRATQNSLDRPVAIKLLPSELNDQTFREQFEAEAKAMARLNHPNLIGIYDFGQTDGMPYIVMELVPGKSLYYSCYQKAIDQTTVCELIIGICRGLAHAHDAGIIHRDIKPANILLDPDAKPKIGDFGLASEGDAEGGMIFGTPGYAAPEILAEDGDCSLGVASDIYAVGVILYELLTGRLPETPPRPPSTITKCDPRLDAVFRRATRRNPAMRYQSAAALATELEELLPNLGKDNRRAIRTGMDKKTAATTLRRQSSDGKLQRTAPQEGRLKLSTGRQPTHKGQGSQAGTAKVGLRPVPAELSTAAGGESDDAPANPVPAPSVVTLAPSSNWPIIRNLMIIAVLVPVVLFAWGLLQKKEERMREKEKAEQIEKQREDEERRVLFLEEERERDLARKKKRELDQERDRAVAQSTAHLRNEGESDTPKTATEQLEESRTALRGGVRHRFPKGTIDRSTHFLFVVDEPMTWAAAADYAEGLGGHLATPITAPDVDVIAERLRKDGVNRAWLGGGARGRNTFGWITGATWTFRSPDTILGSCAALTKNGLIKARPNGEKNPFVIQWSKDGTNPGSLAAQLSRLAPTLSTPSPAWPPTSVVQDNRVFLFVKRDVSWDEADLLAISGGGHLAVVSHNFEATFINKYLASCLSEGGAAWLGGRRTDESWGWTTGEPWAKAWWRTNSPDGGNSATALRFSKSNASSGWDDSDPSEGNTTGFLIEWSNDASLAKPVVGDAKVTRGELVKLRSIGRQLVVKQLAEHKKRLLGNQKTLIWDYRSWFRTQSKSVQDNFPDVGEELANSLPESGRIENNLPIANFPQKLSEYHQKALLRQTRFDAQFKADLENLRQTYITKLLDLRSKLQASGLKGQAALIDDEIQGVGQDGESFRRHFSK